MTTTSRAVCANRIGMEPWMKDRKYPETPEEWCALHDTDEPDSIYATRDRARAAIAKVEGRW